MASQKMRIRCCVCKEEFTHDPDPENSRKKKSPRKKGKLVKMKVSCKYCNASLKVPVEKHRIGIESIDKSGEERLGPTSTSDSEESWSQEELSKYVFPSEEDSYEEDAFD